MKKIKSDDRIFQVLQKQDALNLISMVYWRGTDKKNLYTTKTLLKDSGIPKKKIL